VLLSLVAFWSICGSASLEGADLCSMAKRNPPWFVFTALAAVPAVLLTWYWRDQHKRADLAFIRLQQMHQDFGRLLQQATDTEHPSLQAAAVVALPPYVVGPYELSPTQHPFRRPALTAIANALRSSSASEKTADVVGDARLLGEASQEALELCRDHLSHVVLVGACMHCPNLEGADLRGAHLEHAVLWRGNLRRAQLDQAYLAFTSLFGADLRGSTLANAYCVDALYDDDTRFPDGFDPSRHRMVKKPRHGP